MGYAIPPFLFLFIFLDALQKTFFSFLFLDEKFDMIIHESRPKKKTPLGGYILYTCAIADYTQAWIISPCSRPPDFPIGKKHFLLSVWYLTIESQNCWVSSLNFFNFHICVCVCVPATVGLNGVFFYFLYPCNFRLESIHGHCSIWKKKEWPGKKIFLTSFYVWIDGRRFPFQSKSQQPNTYDSDTIRFPNFICKNTGLCCNQFRMCVCGFIFTSGCGGGNVKAKKELDEHFLFFWYFWVSPPPNGSIKSRHGPNLGVSRPWVNQVGGFLSRSFSPLAFEYYLKRKKLLKNKEKMARDDGRENLVFLLGAFGIWNFVTKRRIRTRENARKTINENEWTLVVWPSLDCKLGRAV